MLSTNGEWAVLALVQPAGALFEQGLHHSFSVQIPEVGVRLARSHEHNRLACGVGHGYGCPHLQKINTS